MSARPQNPFDIGLERRAVNFAPLTPSSFIAWSAHVCPGRTAVIHGDRRFTWAETYARCRRLASALSRWGLREGDTVAVMLANTPEMYECHFGVPMAGCVLNALNTRLDARALAFMLDHGEARVLITDCEFADVISDALSLVARRPRVVDVFDPMFEGPRRALGEADYESMLDAGDPAFAWQPPSDEWNAISLNYTSGTTGDPKGVVCHHRGAYLNALGNLINWNMPRHAVYLWTLPMFHCNGWCLPWSLAATVGINVCLRKVDAAVVMRLIGEHRVTHYCGAPIVHNTLLQATEDQRTPFPHRVHALVGGAAPPAATLAAMEQLNVELTHVYGLTEVYGPATLCVKQEEWRDLDVAAQAERNGRQGVRTIVEESVTVIDPETLEPVPWDGATVGEVVFRGNVTMKGYLKNPSATEQAFAGGWFRSGDLAVMQPDGYFKIKDRAKDVIISGGENISSLEVEDAIYHHPAVLAAAVVAQPDSKWGETPCAFVELKPGVEIDAQAIIDHCRRHLAHFKAPKTVVFGPLPKTSTGKIQKFILRERAKSASAIE